jgi:hypothetical protein
MGCDAPISAGWLFRMRWMLVKCVGISLADAHFADSTIGALSIGAPDGPESKRNKAPEECQSRVLDKHTSNL